MGVLQVGSCWTCHLACFARHKNLSKVLILPSSCHIASLETHVPPSPHTPDCASLNPLQKSCLQCGMGVLAGSELTLADDVESFWVADRHTAAPSASETALEAGDTPRLADEPAMSNGNSTADGAEDNARVNSGKAASSSGEASYMLAPKPSVPFSTPT